MPSQPVVGVSWYEALAYCRWLTETLRSWEGTPDLLAKLLQDKSWKIHLPSEAEWEKAARGGDGRIFPWGQKPDPDRANYDDAGIDATSCVGCSPGGTSPYGVEDMAGNVWEWTRSLWRDYPYYPSEEREDLSADPDVARVLRGGPFGRITGGVRCADRYEYYPYSLHKKCGFRIVLAAPSSWA